MKVIFLDVDGVLNSAEQNSTLIDKSNLILLKSLVVQTDAKLVLHSGWRLMFDANGNPLKPKATFLLEELNKEGLTLYAFTDDMSKFVNNRNVTKLKEQAILDWVENHEVERWVVLDDIVFVNDIVKHHSIRVNGKLGLTKWNVELAISLLNYL